MALTKHVTLSAGQCTEIHMGARLSGVTVINRGTAVATPQGSFCYELWVISDGTGAHASVGGDGCSFVPATYGARWDMVCVQLDAVDTPENPANDTVIHIYSTGPALVSLVA